MTPEKEAARAERKCVCLNHPKGEVRVIVCTEDGLIFDGYIKRENDRMVEIMMMEGKVNVEYSELKWTADPEEERK